MLATTTITLELSVMGLFSVQNNSATETQTVIFLSIVGTGPRIFDRYVDS